MRLIEDAYGHLNDLIASLYSVDTLIKSKSDELESINKSIDEAKNLQANDLAKHTEKCKVLTTEKNDLEKVVTPLRAEITRLSSEVSELVNKKSALKLENAKLEEDNKQTRLYETKAMKILQAKESELLERQAIIEQKESLRPKVNTILPPTNE
jgi:chromosome segregation ATPase